jgi:hypothetical protein
MTSKFGGEIVSPIASARTTNAEDLRRTDDAREELPRPLVLEEYGQARAQHDPGYRCYVPERDFSASSPTPVYMRRPIRGHRQGDGSAFRTQNAIVEQSAKIARGTWR